jgi:hemerythrin-like domain-containing protein
MDAVPTLEERTMPNTVFDNLRDDHLRVLGDISAVERALEPASEGRRDARGGRAVRAKAIRPSATWEPLRRLVALLERQFETHMAAEDKVLFPSLERALPETSGALRELEDEHRELRGMLASVAGLLQRRASQARDEQLVVQGRDLVDLLRIHIRKEEVVVFRVAERLLSPAELMGVARRRTGNATTELGSGRIPSRGSNS